MSEHSAQQDDSTISDSSLSSPTPSIELEQQSQIFQNAVDLIPDELLYDIIHIPGPLEPPSTFSAEVLSLLLQIASTSEPRLTSENAIRSWLWYEWQARAIGFTVPLMRLLPFEERQHIMQAILHVIDDRRPW
jgi:hypothetical protein